MISFCLPEECTPNTSWQKAWKDKKTIPLHEGGKEATAHCWIYQTWALLTEAGVKCHLLPQLHPSGVTITLSGLISPRLGLDTSLPRTSFLVDIVADGLPHPSAHFHLVQNKAHARRFPNSLFIPHWPQPHLIPRDPIRGNRFETVSFFGNANNLAPELRSHEWKNQLFRETGLRLEYKGTEEWHDYSTTDCILAIRNFSRSRQLHKPATKLYNAWLAGVPFIGGKDSAYAADGHPGKNYLAATSPNEVIEHLKRLKEDILFRTQLVQSGTLSGAAFTKEATLERWKIVVQETLPKLALKWQKKSMLQRRYFSITHRLFCFADRYLR